jgi:uncharacterized protein (TIGR02145 family)
LGLGIYKITQSVFYIAEYKPTPNNITTMQQMTPAICGAMDMYSSITLQDPRGPQPYQSYRVRKMPDNKCWMIDNLKLELSTGMELKPADTDVLSNTIVTLGGSGVYMGNFITSGNMGGDYWAQANPSDPSQPYTESCATINFVDPASATGCGYLYNWYTATAGSRLQVEDSGSAPGSICPEGWRLPTDDETSGTGDEFAILNSAMYNGSLEGTGYTMDTKYVQNWWHTGLFAGSRSGYYGDGFVNQGSYGYLWSSFAYSSIGARGLGFGHSYVLQGTRVSNKYIGFAVRCVV